MEVIVDGEGVRVPVVADGKVRMYEAGDCGAGAVDHRPDRRPVQGCRHLMRSKGYLSVREGEESGNDHNVGDEKRVARSVASTIWCT